jgi:polyphosphate kinase 2 (PPK2 family)
MLEIVDLSQRLSKKAYRRKLDKYQTRLRALGYQVYQQQRPVVMVFEGWDAAGKGGAIKRLTERLDPRGYVVLPIAAPKGDDADKHYLYRFWRRLPIRGQIAIFDRSWYGRIMVERVEGFCTLEEWQRAYREIQDFERQLAGFGTIILKFWMHLSKEEQLARFESRKQTPYKRWKLTEEDWRNRDKWDPYEQAVEDMLIKTTTVRAPWTIVAANDKRFARVQVLKTVVKRLSSELNFDPTPENLAELPPLAAVTPVPEWAKKEATELGLF